MKFTLLVLVAILLLSLSSTSQDTLLHSNFNLVASRNSQHSYYRPGTRLVIKYMDGSSTQRVRGTFSGVQKGSIAIGAKGGNETVTFIPVEEISMVKKIHPQRRVAFAIIGTVLVGGGTAILGDEGNSPRSAMRGALIIPVIGIGCYFLFAVPVTLLAETLSEKKSEDGWKFELSEQ